MARIQIPLDVLTSRVNIQDRLSSLRNGSLSNRYANLRPLSEFLDVKRISKPAHFSEMQSRVNYNIGRYSSNYAVIVVLLSIWALITNVLLLVDIVFVVLSLYLISLLGGRDLELGSFRATTSQLYTGIIIVAVPLGLFSSPWQTALFIIGASAVVILGHAAFLEKPIEEAFGGEAV